MTPEEMAEFKKTADQLGKSAHDLKAASEQAEKTTGEVKQELVKINDKVTGFEAELKKMRETEKKGGRPNFGGGGGSGEAEEYKGMFINGFMRKGLEDGLLEKAGSLGVDADGGFAVPEEMDAQILELLRNDSVMRQECSVITAGSEAYKKLVNVGGLSTGWVGETSGRPETDSPKLAQIAPIFGEMYANPKATQKMLDDAMFDVGAWYESEILLEFGEAENQALTVGNGVDKPKGFLAHTLTTQVDSARAFGSLQKIVSGSTGSFTPEDILKIIYSTKKKYRDGAKFMMSNSSLLAARIMKDGDGNFIWRSGLELGQASTLAGYEIAENEDMPDVASGAFALAFGNFVRGYTVVDVGRMNMLRDPFTDKPFVGFYSTKRIGGMVTDSNAIKVLEVA
jgi:HK97 family phage major capsid protein